MEWTDMREVFLCGAFARPSIHPEKPQESSASGTSTVSAGPVTFLERQDARVVCGSVIPLGQIGSRKAWEPVLRENV